MTKKPEGGGVLVGSRRGPSVSYPGPELFANLPKAGPGSVHDKIDNRTVIGFIPDREIYSVPVMALGNNNLVAACVAHNYAVAVALPPVQLVALRRRVFGIGFKILKFLVVGHTYN